MVNRSLAQLHLAIHKTMLGAPDETYFFVTPTRTQAWRVIWPEVLKLAELYSWTIFEAQLRVTMKNGAHLKVLESEGDRTRGLMFDRVIFDENPKQLGQING